LIEFLQLQSEGIYEINKSTKKSTKSEHKTQQWNINSTDHFTTNCATETKRQSNSPPTDAENFQFLSESSLAEEFPVNRFSSQNEIG
jgi:hypothetical protein